MPSISVPTTAQLSGSLRLPPTHPVVTKLVSRLSRTSLLGLALSWLAQSSDESCAPYLRPQGHDDSMYEASHSLDDLQDIYSAMRDMGNKGSKREVVDRILEGDWRMGLTLHQLAMADLQYLVDHPLSQRWSAFHVVALKIVADDDGDDAALEVDKQSLVVPRLHPTTFLRNLQAELPPDVKTHCTFQRHATLPLLLLRIFIFDTPYSTDLVAGDAVPSNFEAARTLYIAFPDASHHVYISNAAQIAGASLSSEAKSLRAMVIQNVPKALSRPGERYTLKSTSLATRNMAEMVERRGGGRGNAAAAGWSFYADAKRKESPLDVALPTPPLSDGDPDVRASYMTRPKGRPLDPDEGPGKRRRLLASARFGKSALVDDGLGVERVDVVIEDPFPSAESNTTTSNTNSARSTGQAGDSASQWCPAVKLTFHGPHVFAGVRQLVEEGVIDGERMPGWMTGEEGVTIGAIRHGRIRGHKGSGL